MSTAYDQLYNIRVRLFREQVEKMKELAKTNRRSLAAEVAVAVDRYLAQEGK